MPLMATGGLIIWLGCFSFNASSVLVSASARYANDLDRVNFLIGRYAAFVPVRSAGAAA